MNDPVLSRFAIRPALLDMFDDMVAVRRDLHQHPELGFAEHRTAELVGRSLETLGYEVTSGVARTGVVGLLRGAKPGPVVLVRADMDALPLQEENQRSYASAAPAVMHACGHDGHVATALAVARYYSTRREQLAGTLKLVFQPAEEGPGGALPMIEEGVLRGPDVDVALGLHLWNDLPVGSLGIAGGPIMASADHFILTIQGVGGHGAQPQRTVDPIVTAAHVVTALQTVVSRKTDPFHSAVVTVGSIHGGKANNIIPARVELEGTVRSLVPELRDELPTHLERIVRGVCDAFGATYTLDYRRGYPVTANDPEMARMVAGCARDIVGDAGEIRALKTMGGEDMSYFLRHVPGCFFFVGSSNAAEDLAHPHHSPRFDFDERALVVGAEVMVSAVDKALATVVPGHGRTQGQG